MKKAFGIIFLVLGGLAAYSTFNNLGSIFESVEGLFDCVGRNCKAAHLGTLVGRLLFVAFSIGMFVTGLRWIQSPTPKINSDPQESADPKEEQF